MQKTLLTIIIAFLIVTNATCQPGKKSDKADVIQTEIKQSVVLPAPYATKSVRNYCDVIGWPADKTPIAPAGFKVTRFAINLENPRWIYKAPNGDIFVSEATTEVHGLLKVGAKIVGATKADNLGKSPNRILIFRDANGDGVPELQQEFLSDGLNQPFGMLIAGDHFYVANTDGLMMYPYHTGQTKMTDTGKKILSLPAGDHNRHWTKNIILSKDGRKILVMVGSGTNVAENGLENEIRRANILEINPDGTGERIVASGIRNPVGAAYAPGTSTLWVSVNERDELGDELVPDYLTSVKYGGFYGWPFYYWGSHPDPRMEKNPHPELAAKTIVPDVSLGSHTASLGLAFDEKGTMGSRYSGGAFISQHGSWNRSEITGYKLLFLPFKNGKPSGGLQDFLTGFIADKENKKVYGRPVGICFANDGSMLVADDTGNTIWRVTAQK